MASEKQNKLDKTILLKTAVEHSESLARGDYSAVELAEVCLGRSEQIESFGIYLSLNRNDIINQAEQSDKRRQAGKTLGPLDGIPVALKDNISVEGEQLTCAAKILENFVSPYDSDVVERLKNAGAVLFGRTNLDEFAMGSSTENSSSGNTKNPWNPEHVPGGSSGGSAAAVGSLSVPLALGSDTGGSIRQPASFCGIVGMKPTYGMVSRYGLVAFASSLDQIGPMAKTTEDASLLLSVISGKDPRDSTSHHRAGHAAEIQPVKDWSKLTLGFYDVSNVQGFEPAVLQALEKARDFAEKQGAKIVPVKSKLWDYALSIYYILATAEASSNLSRYDGIRYGKRAEADNLMNLYVRSRTEGFGPEVKRRILLGTFVLSSGYYDAYYNKAQKARKMIRAEYSEMFQRMDGIVLPSVPMTAFPFNSRTADPLAMYQTDLLTITANLGGIPAISIPAGLDHQSGLPIGLQIQTGHFEEQKLFSLASGFNAIPDFALDYNKVID